MIDTDAAEAQAVTDDRFPAHALITLSSKQTGALVKDGQALLARVSGDLNKLQPYRRDDLATAATRPLMSRVYECLTQAPGYVLVRNLPDLSHARREELAAVYWALGAGLGEAVPTNARGDLIGKVKDEKKDLAAPDVRGYETNAAMDWHCDQAIFTGLLCIHRAAAGGTTRIAPSAAVAEELSNRHPEYAAVLSQPFYWTTHGETGADDKPYYTSPVFNVIDGKTSVDFGPIHIRKGHALPGAPPLTRHQEDALAAVETLCAERSKSVLLRPGDGLWLNNARVVHTRDAFVDGIDESSRRELWRLFLRNDDAYPLSPYRRQWINGIRAPGTSPSISV